jgi:prepilin peptidase CpaA
MNFGNPNLAAGSAGSLPALLVLGVVLMIAVYTEVRENRIPNWLTLSGMSLGLVIGHWQGGPVFWSHLGGLTIGFGVMFFFYVLGGIGGGDVKLMGAVGALMGANLIVPTLFYAAYLGALLGLLMLIWQKDFWMRVAWSVQRLAFWRKPQGERPAKPAPIAVPYGVAIAVGCLVTLLLT